MSESTSLSCGGVPLLSAEQGRELGYVLPEGAVLPKPVERFLLGIEVDPVELKEALDGEARSAAADSDRALELLLLASRRLNASGVADAG